MEIIIGREPEKRCLNVVVNGVSKSFGPEGSVPMTVSRKHCKIVVSDNGQLNICNLNPDNITYVDGISVLQKAVTYKSVIELSHERYRLDICGILQKLSLAEYSIAHLEKVWDDYNKEKQKIAEDNAKNAIRNRIPSIFSMAAVAIGCFPSIPSAIRIILIVSGLALTVFFLMDASKRQKEQPKILQALERDLHKKYVCPNPECRQFFNIPYDILSTKKKCPYCGVKFRK